MGNLLFVIIFGLIGATCVIAGNLIGAALSVALLMSIGYIASSESLVKIQRAYIVDLETRLKFIAIGRANHD